MFTVAFFFLALGPSALAHDAGLGFVAGAETGSEFHDDRISLLQTEAVMVKAGARSKAVLSEPEPVPISAFGSSRVCIDPEGAHSVSLSDDSAGSLPIAASIASSFSVSEDENSSTASAGPSSSPMCRYVLAVILGLALSHALGLWRDDAESSSQDCGQSEACEALWAVSQNAPQQKISHTRKKLLADSAEWQEMDKAVRAGEAGELERALVHSSSVDLNAHGKWGCTLLHNAALAGTCSCTELLLDYGARPDVFEAWEETPLHFAAQRGKIEVCKALLARGANVGVLNAQDWTPLLCAGHAGHEPVCKLLLDHGAGAGGVSDNALPPLLVVLLMQRDAAITRQTRMSTQGILV